MSSRLDTTLMKQSFDNRLKIGSVLVGGNMQEKLECQACPRGTVFVSRARGTMTMCRPCPSGTFMGDTGAVANDKGELGECNACPSDAFMTNVFPAYSKDQCQKSKRITNPLRTILKSFLSLLFPQPHQIPSCVCSRFIWFRYSSRLHSYA